MSKPREFWLAGLNSHDVCVFDQKTVSSFRHDFNKNNEYIHVIELTHEVSRKLELFDEAVGELAFYANGGNFNRDLWQDEHGNYFTGKRAKTFLKKLGEHNE